ncbi:MAG: DUF5317 family protein [Chloroflexota bacterium]
MIVPFLAVATALGLLVILAATWRRQPSRVSPVLPRAPWLLLLALIPQLVWTHWLSHQASGAPGLTWWLPASYVPVGLFIALNLGFPWARVIAVGVSLNVAVILANGGTMPAPARFFASESKVTSVVPGQLDPGSKDRLVDARRPALLAPLEDQYIVTLPGGFRRLASVGDFVSLGGAILGLLASL